MKASLLNLVTAQAVALVASIAVTIATAVLLGPSGRGVIAFIFATANLAGAAGFGNLHMGVIHRSPVDDQARLHGLEVAVISSLATGALVALPALFLRHTETATSLLLSAIGAALVTLNLFVLRTGQALGDDRVYRNSWAIQSVLYAILGITAAYTLHNVLSVVVAWFICIVLSTIYSARKFAWQPEPRLSRTGYSRDRWAIFTSAWSAHIGIVGLQVLSRGNIVALGFFHPPNTVGVYSVASPIAELVWMVSEAVSLTMFRSLTSVSADERRSLRRKLTSVNLAATSLGALAIGIASWLVIPRFLPEYNGAVVIIVILLPGVICQGASRVALASIVATPHGRQGVTVGITSMILSLLYIPAAALSGVNGVACTTLCLYIVQAVYIHIVDRRI